MSPTPLQSQVCHWHVFTTVAELEQAALTLILETANASIAARGAFHVVLAGGTTPQHVYAALAATEADWACWHVYFGDERCLPTGHIERNSLMATEAWLLHVPIPPGQIHPIPAELPFADLAQRSTTLRKRIADSTPPAPNESPLDAAERALSEGRPVDAESLLAKPVSDDLASRVAA